MDLAVVLMVGAFVAFSVGRIIHSEYLSPDARIKQTLARRKRVSIAEAREGLVLVAGRARATGELLRAPVSQRPCIAFLLLVERKKSGIWEEALVQEEACPFVVEDETAKAFIDIAAGPFSLALVPDRRGAPSLFGDEDDALKTVRALLRSQNIETETMLGLPQILRFSEGVLLPNRHVAVSGLCAREVVLDGERSTYREPPLRLVVRGTTDEPLLISSWRRAREEPVSE